MTSTYKVNADLLDINFINSLKSIYHNRNIKIVVTLDNINNISDNEIEYRVNDLNNSNNAVSFTNDEFNKLNLSLI